MLELAEVAELVVGGQSARRGPSSTPRPARPAAINTRALQRSDRADVGGEVADVAGVRPRPAARARRPGRLRPGGSEPRRRASGTGSAAGRSPRPGPRPWCEVLRRPPPGHSARAGSRSMPTCMSAAPRRAVAPGSVASVQAPLVGAHRFARADPARSACRPGRWRSRRRRTGSRPVRSVAMASAYRAVRRLQVPARPVTRGRAAPPPRHARPGSSSSDRSSARRACAIVPATSPRSRARPARCMAIARRQLAERLLVDDDHPVVAGPFARCASLQPRSASCRRASTPSISPRTRTRPGVPRCSARA